MSNSLRALQTSKTILQQNFQGVYALKAIDVHKNSWLAEEDKILATPSHARFLPLPVRRIIGNLWDREKVLISLVLLYENIKDRKI